MYYAFAAKETISFVLASEINIITILGLGDLGDIGLGVGWKCKFIFTAA
jgi:hypothetical protein